MDSAVSIVTVLWFYSRKNKGCLTSPKRPDCHWDPPVGAGGVLLGINRPEREADQPLSRGVEVKNNWSSTSTLSMYHHGVRRASVIVTLPNFMYI